MVEGTEAEDGRLATHLGVFPSRSPPALAWKAKTHRTALEQRGNEVGTGFQAGLSCVQVAHPSVQLPGQLWRSNWSCVLSVSSPPFTLPLILLLKMMPHFKLYIQVTKPLSALWSPPRIHSGPAKDSKASDSSHPVPLVPMTLNSPADHTRSDVAREPLGTRPHIGVKLLCIQPCEAGAALLFNI